MQIHRLNTILTAINLLSSSTHSRPIMGDDSLSLSWELPQLIDFKIGNYRAVPANGTPTLQTSTSDGNFSKNVVGPFGMPDWEEITDEGQMNVVINPEI